MNNKRKNIVAIITIALIALIAAAAIFVSYRISTGQGIVPTGSRAATCEEHCPNPTTPNLLQSCTPPESDGTSSDSVCTTTGRVEVCGNENWCCPSVGGAWTKDMTKCPTAPTTTPTPPTKPSECGVCTSTSGCATGLTCDETDGRCKKADGSTICFETSAACSVSATAICVATAEVTCSPDCPTTCGQAASVITTCTDSCGVATTKQCAATAVCQVVDVSITKKAFKEGSTTDITTVSRNQTFIYALVIKNDGTAPATNVTVSDTLDGENQDLLTFVDTTTDCTFSNSNYKVTCSGITLAVGASKTLTFRVKVSNAAVNGTVITNTSELSYGDTVKTADKDLAVKSVVACNESCTDDSECTTGLTCDTGTETCRKAACLDAGSCVCPTTAPTDEITAAPTDEITAAPTDEIVDGGTVAPTDEIVDGGTVAPTDAVAQREVLPETGILDFPGIAAFGGGLMLAIIGILLAL